MGNKQSGGESEGEREGEKRKEEKVLLKKRECAWSVIKPPSHASNLLPWSGAHSPSI
jgi:hypothetical protein